MTAKERKIKAGNEGEEQVKVILEEIANEMRAIHYDFCYHFESAYRNSSHQLDAMPIKKNVYIIEVKSYRKILECKLDSDTWTIEYHKTGDADRKRNGMDNPIKQNRNHKKMLARELSDVIGNEHIIAISTVISETDILHGHKWKKVREGEYIVKPQNLVELIMHIEENTPNDIDFAAVEGKLRSLPKVSAEEHREYTKTIKAAKKLAKKNSIYNNLDEMQFINKICPECGHKMYICCSKYGLFFGCSDFPRCKCIEKWK